MKVYMTQNIFISILFHCQDLYKQFIDVLSCPRSFVDFCALSPTESPKSHYTLNEILFIFLQFTQQSNLYRHLNVGSFWLVFGTASIEQGGVCKLKKAFIS